MPAFTYPVSYAQVQDVLNAFPAIGSVTALASTVIAQTYIGPVEAMINAKVGKKYALPIAGFCPVLAQLSMRESVYRIVVGRALVTFPPAQQGRHPLQIQHTDDLKLLEDISTGDAELFIVNSDGSFSTLVPADLTQAEIFSNTMNYNPTFTEGKWYDQVQDTDKLSDIIGDREGRGL